MTRTVFNALRPLIDFNTTLHHFTDNPTVIEQRVKSRLSRNEAFALFFNLGFLGILVVLHTTYGVRAFDYGSYTNTVHGDFSEWHYAHWFLPVFSALEALPGESGFALWSLANIAGIFCALRVFGGRVAGVMLSYQMLYALFYGQIIGVILGGLALFWWGMARRRWDVAGFGLLVACTKYQVGVPFGLTLWLLADVTWRERLRILAVPTGVALLSLVVYPLWPLDALDYHRQNPPGDWGSISLWRWIGPLALLLWIPPVVLHLSPARRVIAVIATSALALPYFQQGDLLALFVLPVGGLGLLGNLGYLYLWFRWSALRLLVIIPLIAYLSIAGPPLYGWVRRVTRARFPRRTLKHTG